MSLWSYFIGALLTLAIVSVGYCGICDNGPPRRLCTDDLTGYHNCTKDPKTGDMIDHVQQCPPNTRCICMGMPCNTDQSCGEYKLPPSWPQDYNLHYSATLKTCDSKGCFWMTSLSSRWRDTKNKRYRRDTTLPKTGYQYYILLPNDNSTYDKYLIDPGKKSCTKSMVPSFPDKYPDIPSYYTYNGTETVKGRTTDRWLWVVGGRHDGEVFNSSVWNVLDGGPKQYRARDQMPSDPSQLSRDYNLHVTQYIPGIPDIPGIFALPGYCDKETERFVDVDWDRIENDDWVSSLNTLTLL